MESAARWQQDEDSKYHEIVAIRPTHQPKTQPSQLKAYSDVCKDDFAWGHFSRIE